MSGGTCHSSIHISYSSSILLDGGFLNSQNVGRYSSLVFFDKKFCHGCFGRPGVQGSAITAFNPLAAQRCVAQTKVPFISLSIGGSANLSRHNKSLPAILERMGSLVSLKDVQTVAFLALKQLLFGSLISVGLSWHTIGIYHSAISAFFGSSLSLQGFNSSEYF